MIKNTSIFILFCHRCLGSHFTVLNCVCLGCYQDRKALVKVFVSLLEFIIYLFEFQTVEDTMHVVVPSQLFLWAHRVILVYLT